MHFRITRLTTTPDWIQCCSTVTRAPCPRQAATAAQGSTLGALPSCLPSTCGSTIARRPCTGTSTSAATLAALSPARRRSTTTATIFCRSLRIGELSNRYQFRNCESCDLVWIVSECRIVPNYPIEYDLKVFYYEFTSLNLSLKYNYYEL